MAENKNGIFEEKLQKSHRVSQIHGDSNFNMVDELVKLQKILQLAEEMDKKNVYRNEAYEHGRKRRK